MKIKREINGVEHEFELSYEEIELAHRTRELEYMIDDVRMHADEEYSGENYNLDYSDIREIAERALDGLSRNDSYFDSYWCTVDYTIEEYVREAKNVY